MAAVAQVHFLQKCGVWRDRGFDRLSDPAEVSRGKTRVNRAGCIGACVLALLIMTASSVFAEQDTFLEKSGIRYPEGFDVNTVGEIRGSVSGFQVPEKGPVLFTLSSKRDTYTVIASPKWYWEDSEIPMQDGLEVRVTGSKTLGKDGNLYVVAQELTVVSSGMTYSLRSMDGSPLWKGPRFSSGGFRRAGEPPFRGGGGGFGRGRR